MTESLSNQDQQICSCLEDKLRIYAELVDMSGFEDVHVEPHLLVKPDYGETPQAASLLVAALREGEFVQECAVVALQLPYNGIHNRYFKVIRYIPVTLCNGSSKSQEVAVPKVGKEHKEVCKICLVGICLVNNILL